MIKWITLLILILISCGTPQYVSPTREYITSNIDSICQVDTLPINSEDWILNPLQDYETREGIIQYLYVKDSIIYIRTDSTIIKRL